MTLARVESGLQIYEQRIREADAAGGEALLAKCAALAEARRAARRGEWGPFLKRIGLNERMAQRHVVIYERATADPQFRERVRTGWLSFTVAALAATADQQMLEQIMALPAPPTQTQVEALGDPTLPAPQTTELVEAEKPDSAVGFLAPIGESTAVAQTAQRESKGSLWFHPVDQHGRRREKIYAVKRRGGIFLHVGLDNKWAISHINGSLIGSFEQYRIAEIAFGEIAFLDWKTYSGAGPAPKELSVQIRSILERYQATIVCDVASTEVTPPAWPVLPADLEGAGCSWCQLDAGRYAIVCDDGERVLVEARSRRWDWYIASAQEALAEQALAHLPELPGWRAYRVEARLVYQHQATGYKLLGGWPEAQRLAGEAQRDSAAIEALLAGGRWRVAFDVATGEWEGRTNTTRGVLRSSSLSGLVQLVAAGPPPLDWRVLEHDGSISLIHARYLYALEWTGSYQEASEIASVLDSLQCRGWSISYDPGAEGRPDLHPWSAGHNNFAPVSAANPHQLLEHVNQARSRAPLITPQKVQARVCAALEQLRESYTWLGQIADLLEDAEYEALSNRLSRAIDILQD